LHFQTDHQASTSSLIFYTLDALPGAQSTEGIGISLCKIKQKNTPCKNDNISEDMTHWSSVSNNKATKTLNSTKTCNN